VRVPPGVQRVVAKYGSAWLRKKTSRDDVIQDGVKKAFEDALEMAGIETPLQFIGRKLGIANTAQPPAITEEEPMWLRDP